MSFLIYIALAAMTAGAYYLLGKYSRRLFDRLYRPYENGRR